MSLNYNVPISYNSDYHYDGTYPHASIDVSVSTATGVTNNPTVTADANTNGTLSTAEGITYNPTIIAVSNADATIVVSVSTAVGITYTPIIPSTITETESIRLIDGYPVLSDIVLTGNRKVAVVGSKLAYKLTDKFWTKI